VCQLIVLLCYFYCLQKQAVDDMLLGEDSKSIAKHITMMKSEMKKKEPNRSVLRDAMKRTAAYRQKYCHEHTTTEVLDEFPVLKIGIFVIIYSSFNVRSSMQVCFSS